TREPNSKLGAAARAARQPADRAPRIPRSGAEAFFRQRLRRPPFPQHLADGRAWRSAHGRGARAADVAARPLANLPDARAVEEPQPSVRQAHLLHLLDSVGHSAAAVALYGASRLVFGIHRPLARAEPFHRREAPRRWHRCTDRGVAAVL